MIYTSDPEILAILARARAYYREHSAADGSPPTVFYVTPEEFRRLESYGVNPGQAHGALWDETVGELVLYGMWVLRERERRTVVSPCQSIRHATAQGLCQTDLLMDGLSDIPCPCGEVLWDLRPMLAALGARAAPHRGWEIIDSEQMSLEEWSTQVDRLLAWGIHRMAHEQVAGWLTQAGKRIGKVIALRYSRHVIVGPGREGAGGWAEAELQLVIEELSMMFEFLRWEQQDFVVRTTSFSAAPDPDIAEITLYAVDGTHEQAVELTCIADVSIAKRRFDG